MAETKAPTVLKMTEHYKQDVEKFKRQWDTFSLFTKKLKALIEEMLQSEGLKFHKIEARTKDVDSFEQKILNPDKEYKEPIKEVQDLAAIRVIVNYTDEVEIVSNLLKKEFEVIYHEIGHQPEEQDPDRFGYVSDHYNLKLSDGRGSLFDWEPYKEIVFEVQIRTILQHGWASISHALKYKDKHDVPIPVQRRLNRLSGLLELADEQFLAIREDVTLVAADVRKIAKDEKRSEEEEQSPEHRKRLRVALTQHYNILNTDPEDIKFGDLPIDTITIENWLDESPIFKTHVNNATDIGLNISSSKSIDILNIDIKQKYYIEERVKNAFGQITRQCQRLGIKNIQALAETLNYISNPFLKKLYAGLESNHYPTSFYDVHLLFILLLRSKFEEFDDYDVTLAGIPDGIARIVALITRNDFWESNS